jgi:hypothetical protein
MNWKLILKDAQAASLSNKNQMERAARKTRVVELEAGSVRWLTFSAARRMMALQMTPIASHKQP